MHVDITSSLLPQAFGMSMTDSMLQVLKFQLWIDVNISNFYRAMLCKARYIATSYVASVACPSVRNVDVRPITNAAAFYCYSISVRHSVSLRLQFFVSL